MPPLKTGVPYLSGSLLLGPEMTCIVSIVCDRLPDLKAEAVQRLSSLQPSDPAGFLTEQTTITVITDRRNIFLQTDWTAMPSTSRFIDPNSLSEKERAALRDQLHRLSRSSDENTGPITLRIEREGADTTIALPAAAAGALLDVLADLAEGRTVSIADADKELTTREAAELLNVSRPYLTRLLKDGEIPSHKVGSHHRVYRRDVLTYKAQRQKESEEAMDDLTKLSQELGLYE
jgi:excisionase family DNA binding protein